MANAETTVRYFLRTRLIGGPVASRAFDTEVPPGQDYPLILSQMQSGVDARINGPQRAHTNLVYLVRGIYRSATYDDVDPIADWIDSQIDRTSHVPVFKAGVLIGTVISCVRDQVWRFAESPNGVAYRHKGGIYRLMVQAV